MSVLPAISLAHVRRELKSAHPIVTGLDLEIDTSMLSEADLRFRVSGRSRVDGERYIVEFRCDDYREKPPFVEFIDPETGEAGTKHAYPDCFHNRPCVCARYNRKTYSEHTGLHGDWEYGEWVVDGTTDHLGGMISHIWSHIHGYQGNYSGRQA